MKKYYFLLFCFIVLGTNIALSAIVNFSAIDFNTNKILMLDSVKVINNTNGQSLVLKDNWTLELNSLTCVDEIDKPTVVNQTEAISFDQKTNLFLVSETVSNARISIFDLNGTVICNFNLNILKGANNIELSAGALPLGVYFLAVESDGISKVFKLLKTGEISDGEVTVKLTNNPSGTPLIIQLENNFTAIGFRGTYRPDTVLFDEPTSEKNIIFSLISDSLLTYNSINININLSVFVTNNTDDCPYQTNGCIHGEGASNSSFSMSDKSNMWTHNSPVCVIDTYNSEFDKIHLYISEDTLNPGTYELGIIGTYSDYNNQKRTISIFAKLGSFTTENGSSSFSMTGDSVKNLVSYHRYEKRQCYYDNPTTHQPEICFVESDEVSQPDLDFLNSFFSITFFNEK
jgi:hypothetical protein